MVLGWQRPGRVGRRRIQFFWTARGAVLFFGLPFCSPPFFGQATCKGPFLQSAFFRSDFLQPVPFFGQTYFAGVLFRNPPLCLQRSQRVKPSSHEQSAASKGKRRFFVCFLRLRPDRPCGRDRPRPARARRRTWRSCRSPARRRGVRWTAPCGRSAPPAGWWFRPR